MDTPQYLFKSTISWTVHVFFSSLPPNYPCIPPVFEIETNQSQSLSYRDADQLYDLLMMEATNGLGKGVIFSLVSAARDFVAELLEKRLQEEQELSKKDVTQNEPTETEVRTYTVTITLIWFKYCINIYHTTIQATSDCVDCK